ncbi:isochorismatase family protein [Secundilactobacillus folii]|uniref:Isochorismatase family protein n=1 Tax=Secundilactobacillus folii TaxID=2678357 RepID=A0A7X2XV99_9LACO|nr:isochorismatase family protein [Secundilactobacillus folii]MTV82279.1 isochorismatase family protein [Secundilactobacillus folii]
MALPTIEPSKTAYIAIDMQDNILAAPTIGPSTSAEVLAVNNQLANRLKNTAILIVQVTVNMPDVQNLFPFPNGFEKPPLSPNTARLMMPIAHDDSATNVITVTKHNPSAFFGTDLEVQLQRQGIDTIILTGVSSSNGVYATGFDAYEHRYRVISVEDACADRDPESHRFFFRKIFPRIGWVTESDKLLQHL